MLENVRLKLHEGAAPVYHLVCPFDFTNTVVFVNICYEVVLLKSYFATFLHVVGNMNYHLAHKKRLTL